jgi:S-adenosylmethionine:tRNA ribosyltransferase-isomerase
LTTELDFNDEKIVLSVSRKHEASDEVSFQWSGKVTFSELIEKTGQTPLPPYLKRPALPLDRTRYQTIYCENDGAVAAPTAGLHFTPRLMQQLIDKGIGQEFITLHVSAGTFKPVKEADYRNHDMHSEQIQVSSKSLENIIHHKGQVIAVGTTSLRILESLYWMGFKIYKKMKDPFHIDKLMPYQVTRSELLPTNDALGMIAEHLSKTNSTILKGETEIFIFPGYDFKICNGLITNYHMPQSTLLLLIAAFTDNDWKKIYHEALRKNYRFLSYGDSSLLLR